MTRQAARWITFSPDFTLVAASDGDEQLEVVEVATGRPYPLRRTGDRSSSGSPASP